MYRLLIVLAAIILFAIPAKAAPSYSSARSELRNLTRSEAKFARTLKRLTPANRAKLKKALAKTGKDSDSDGVNDTYEKARGSNLCDSDSDDDGIDDDDDSYEKDDDKVGEVEVKGTITSFEDPTLVVGGKTFNVPDSGVTYRAPLTSKASLTDGLCIEVEGYKEPDNSYTATKIKQDDDCDGSDDD